MPTVLVVDDVDVIRDTLNLLLTDEGYNVAQAPDSVRAVEMLRQMRERAVVLFDYLMSEGNGLDLFTEVAKDDRLKYRFAYICMSATDRSRLPTEFQMLLDQMEVPFVDKPFDTDDLLTEVANANQRLRKAL